MRQLIVLVLVVMFISILAVAQDQPKKSQNHYVTVNRDSVEARITIVKGWITQQREYLKRVPDVEKSLAQNEAYLQGLTESISDSTFVVKEKGK